jgi:lipopolysaccharide export system permease protein
MTILGLTHLDERATSGERRLSPTISLYIARLFIISVVFFYVTIGVIVVFASAVDLLNRFGRHEGVDFVTVLSFAFLKLPFILQEVSPFILLFASLGTFWRLVRRNELVVMRASGVSVWQFLAPILICALLIGALVVTMLNPIAAATYGRFVSAESKILQNRTEALDLSASGLWVRQADLSALGSGAHFIIHASVLNRDAASFKKVIAFQFDKDGKFVSRFDAKSAQLKPRGWELQAVWQNAPGRSPQFKRSMMIPSNLEFSKLESSFASAETISFWNLPGFIEVLQEAGFPARAHRLQWHRLLAMPALFAAMVLLAATTSLRPHRRGRVVLLMLIGMTTGFVLYIASSIVFALGQTGKIPIVLAAWTPAGVSLMLGVALLLHLEDG